MFSKTNQEIDILIRSRYPLIYIVSYEEQRVENSLISIAQKRNKKYYFWTFSEGLHAGQGVFQLPESRDPLISLDYIYKCLEPSIFVFKDFHAILEKDQYLSSLHINKDHVIRKIKDLILYVKKSFHTIIFLSSRLVIPAELEKDITVFDYPLPDYDEIKQILENLITSVVNNPKVIIDLNDEVKEKFIKAAQGFTISESENVFAKAIVNNGRLDVDDISLIISEKKQIIRKTGILEYYETDEKFGQIGGLNNLKEWILKRTTAFSEKARKFGLPHPKGLLLLGIQGCGKSLTSKAIASLWNLPLLRLDMGNVFSGIVGSSEDNMRKAIKMAESLSPCVLWLDEIEKGLSGMKSSGMTDGGTTARVMGTFLTWLQEKTYPVFVVATANDIQTLPPELLRKGRLDEIFFIDLPCKEERKEIFNIHIIKRNRNPENFNMELLTNESEGFSGAEIEQAIISALYDAFAKNVDITTEDIIKTIKETFPLSETMREEIEELKNWSRLRARQAS